MYKIFKFFIILFTLICATNSARILGIFHMSSYSHFILGDTLLKSLAEKGHDVTMISAFEQSNNMTNYRTVQVPEIFDYIKKMDFMQAKNLTFLDNLKLMMDFLQTVTELTLNNTNVQNLLKSNDKFDVMIMEQFVNEAFRGFQYHYDIPCIVFSTIKSNVWVNNIMGNPQNPSYIEEIMTSFRGPMTFFQRIYNSFLNVINYLMLFNISYPLQDKLMHKYFPDAPQISELIYNTSLVLLNSHPTISSPAALLPNMIEVAGMHVKSEQQLPDDIKTYLDDAPEGVIYFSLGSNLKSKDIDPIKRDAIIRVFSKLNMKILWKFEDETLAHIAKNIKISKWLPQQDILAHPNVKLFITHGGFLSTIETIYHGKPVLGIPFFGDQEMNMQEAENAGYGLLLNYDDLTEETFSNTLKELLTNPSYAQTAQKKSAAFRDQPESPLERAVYWVEFVIRQKGAYHLRSNALNLSWYQYMLIDVITFIALCLLFIVLIISKSVKFVLKLFGKKKVNAKKNN